LEFGFQLEFIGFWFSIYSAEHAFADYRPSIIAFAAFMAACKRAYPSKHDEIEHALRLSEIGPRVC